jgi:aspartyl-tRNA(Asn)/glutamyl-tRNA(Gln) amidotransferase subunit C
MEINNELISKLENLARLQLEPAEKESLMFDLSNIITMFNKMNEVDTNNVEPLIYINEQVNIWREDIVKNQLSNDEALLNAPEFSKPYFTVPKMMD